MIELNVKSSYKHQFLLSQIHQLDPSQDNSRSAIFSRSVQAAKDVENWNEIQKQLAYIRKPNEEGRKETFNLKVKYDEKCSQELEAIKTNILSDLPDIKILQTQYFVQLLLQSYISRLRKEARLGQELDTDDVNAAEAVKLFVELIMLEPDSESYQKIRQILIDWRNKL